MTKTLKDEQIHFLNENKETANYAQRSKSKKARLGKQKKRGIKKRSDDKKEKKKQKVSKYKTCGGKH